MQETLQTWIRSLGQEVVLEKDMATHSSSSILALENPMDREAEWAIVHRVTKSQTRLKWFSTHTHTGNLKYCLLNLNFDFKVNSIKNKKWYRDMKNNHPWYHHIIHIFGILVYFFPNFFFLLGIVEQFLRHRLVITWKIFMEYYCI